MLMYISANQVLVEGIWLEVAVQDGRVAFREAKQPQKVSTLL